LSPAILPNIITAILFNYSCCLWSYRYNTVERRYIEVQGTSSKCSIYPEFDISALRRHRLTVAVDNRRRPTLAANGRSENAAFIWFIEQEDTQTEDSCSVSAPITVGGLWLDTVGGVWCRISPADLQAGQWPPRVRRVNWLQYKRRRSGRVGRRCMLDIAENSIYPCSINPMPFPRLLQWLVSGTKVRPRYKRKFELSKFDITRFNCNCFNFNSNDRWCCCRICYTP